MQTSPVPIAEILPPRAEPEELPPQWSEYDLALYLNISCEACRKMRDQGTGPPFVELPTGAIRYPEDQLLAWLERHTHTVTPANGQRKQRTQR